MKKIVKILLTMMLLFVFIGCSAGEFNKSPFSINPTINVEYNNNNLADNLILYNMIGLFLVNEKDDKKSARVYYIFRNTTNKELYVNNTLIQPKTKVLFQKSFTLNSNNTIQDILKDIEKNFSCTNCLLQKKKENIYTPNKTLNSLEELLFKNSKITIYEL